MNVCIKKGSSQKRRIVTYLGIGVLIYLAGFVIWSCIFPVDMEVIYKGDSPIGYYRFKIVQWEFSNGSTFYVIEELGGTIDYFKYLVGCYNPPQ